MTQALDHMLNQLIEIFPSLSSEPQLTSYAEHLPLIIDYVCVRESSAAEYAGVCVREKTERWHRLYVCANKVHCIIKVSRYLDENSMRDSENAQSVRERQQGEVFAVCVGGVCNGYPTKACSFKSHCRHYRLVL